MIYEIFIYRIYPGWGKDEIRSEIHERFTHARRTQGGCVFISVVWHNIGVCLSEYEIDVIAFLKALNEFLKIYQIRRWK